MNRFVCFVLFVTLLASAVLPSVAFAENVSEPASGGSVVDHISQAIFIAVMSIGILGLPAYFWLNARRNKLLREFNDDESNDEKKPDEKIEASEEINE